MKRPGRKIVVESDIDGGRVREGKLGARYRGRESWREDGKGIEGK